MRKPDEIVEAARRKWPSALRAEAAGENLFPLQIPFGRPATTEDFGQVRLDLEKLATAAYEWVIDWEEVNTRKWGLQRWPRRIRFESIEKLAHTLELDEELRLFREALLSARCICPKLEPWLRTKAYRIPEFLLDWNGLIAVCAFFDSNPSPQCFPRQLPIPVGTKFIEEHAGILGELLDVVLGDRVNVDGSSFEERFHLLSEPPQVRFRFLDASLRERVQWPVMDCSISAEDFAGMHWNIPRILIVENKAVFLCLPNLSNTLAVLGNGKAAVLLTSCNWMRASDLVYWGDCDEAGLGILSSIRAIFPGLRSVLMDAETWKRWQMFAVVGKRDPSAQHDNLTAKEEAVLKAVVAGPWMLEQERIPVREAESAIKAAFKRFSDLSSS
jgi:hypothetical protein